MNEVIRTMEERRSIRKFNSRMPSEEDIRTIIEAGLYAPSGMGKQAVITLAVTDRKLRDRLSEVNAGIGGFPKGMDPFYGAPVILVVLFDKSAFTGIYDGSLVMGNMMNAAASLGLGSIWIHRAKEEFEKEEFRNLLKDLGVQGEWEGVGHVALGYAEGETPKAAPRKDGRVYWVK